MDRMMNILITGKNGYIANSIKLELSKLYSITSIGRSDFNLLSSKETNNFFNNKYFDVVIHTAISGGNRLVPETKKDIDINLQMYYNLLQNKQHYGKLISFGSGAEIYSNDTPYGISKKIIAESMMEYDNMYNIRIYAVFDENELERRFIKSNIKRYINHDNIIIHTDKWMDFFYMKDLIKLIEYYIKEKNPPKEMDCSYRYKYKLSDIASIINKLSNHTVKIDIENIELSNHRYTGKFTELSIQYIGIEKGIQETYNKLLENYGNN